MTTEKINQLFEEAIDKDNRIPISKLEGISKDKIYNWRNGRNANSITIGEKLNLLLQLGKIKIIENDEPDRD
ncbi:hypothetical protein AAGV28_07190 [Flavobacterium sp. FZUC8N2.13]|uniref:XRE family transcriptional regulator n=1 Tax=Flavobacterium zubiriense TaxID=3138075 RepID=A0ABV4TAU4_9FLAO